MTKKTSNIVRASLVGAFVSLGGWYMFQGMSSFIPISSDNPIALIAVGIIIAVLAVKIGWQ